MMISPEAFRKMYEKKSLKTLYGIRRELMEDIINFENHPEEEDFMLPSRETVYVMNNLYLLEICRLIKEKTEG